MIKPINFDENLFGESWRFNSPDCKLDTHDKKRLAFLNPEQSLILWKEEISRKYFHLMKIPRKKIEVIDKIVLDFDRHMSGKEFFSEKIMHIKTVIFFWGPKSACITPLDVLIKSWTDFFYPSDENSIMSLPNTKEKIFSFEETFFFATFQ